MHIVSMSKFMSAIGLVHLLDAKGIPTSAKIINWLPDYWSTGSNIGLIDFEDLMNHLSGFSTGGSASNWFTMKANVQAGVAASDVGNTPDYENLNFGLLRILMATIGGYIHPSTNFGFGFLNDVVWDVMTAQAYNDYMQKNVFSPVGASPRLSKTALTALAYRFDASSTGWNTGSFWGSPGGVGWHMTINEILNVARGLRTGQIISGIDAQTLLNQSWGLNSAINGESTDAGRLYYKPGLWQDNNNASVARTEQGVLLMAPDNVEIVVFVNSPVTSSGMSLQNLVRTLYKSNIVIAP
jgi:CubicO group peptidase (beta-lactamase class C family)